MSPNSDSKFECDEIRFVSVSSPKEWDAYHRIREEQIFVPINVVYDRNHPTLTLENHFHLVLYKGTKIASVAHIEFLNNEEVALRSLATDEPYKNQGFGKAMMQFLEKWVKQQGKRVIKMHAALNAEGFYRKLGYYDMLFEDTPISNETIDLGKLL